MTTRLATLTAAPLAALALLAAPPAGAIVIDNGFIDNFVGDPNLKTCPTLMGDPDLKSQRPALFELVEIDSVGTDEREAAVAADRNLDELVCRFMGDPND